jgi:hypothetical protein
MKVKASIVVMSHLSDAQEELNMIHLGLRESIQRHINFAKYICFHVVDLSTEIDADEMYESFLKSNTK